ncbi:hypothetical protein CPY51_17375 [Rhizobium tubonense]|uniref:KTSC domain-containing protein n=2 Tax=Rhizobium tubonense TaxID=484088 RepID=A0A2W4CHW8_9HYPH|nr:hypothetical protein CPY51_17375 [Rhizobium tubonense]
MRRRSMQWFAAVCCAASLASAAIAAEDYPCKPEGDRDSAFYDIEHMDPNYLIKLHLGGFSFAIPYAYESWRSTPERVNCSPVRDRFEFALLDAGFTTERERRIPQGQPAKRGKKTAGRRLYRGGRN